MAAPFLLIDLSGGCAYPLDSLVLIECAGGCHLSRRAGGILDIITPPFLLALLLEIKSNSAVPHSRPPDEPGTGVINLMDGRADALLT